MNREDEFTEFKKTTGELNDAMISLSAILNKHESGTIYFGLKNDGTPFPFAITDSTLRDISIKIYESIRPQIFPNIETVLIDNVEVIKLTFEGHDIPYSANGRYYIRMGDVNRELTPDALRKIMISKEYDENWDDKSTKETIDDIDEIVFNKFYHKAIECGRLPDFGNDKKIILSKLGLLSGEYLSNAGKMLFSKNKPIVLKMAVFATDHKTTFLDITREEGNIFSLIDLAMQYIIKNIRWRVKFVDYQIERLEIPEVPIDALREAVVNSFIHAKYDGNVQHEIDIFSNRISIINPGCFACNFEPTDFINRDLKSYLRNERIAKILYLSKDVETFASGLRKIYSLCDKENVSVNYINNENDFTLEFSRFDINVIREDGFNFYNPNSKLNQSENEIIKLIAKDKNLTIEQLSNLSGKSIRTINRILSSLKEKNLISRYGSNKTGYWKVNI